MLPPNSLQPIELQYNPEVEPDDISLEVRDLPLKKSETPEGKKQILAQSKVLIGKFLKSETKEFGREIAVAKKLLNKWQFSVFEQLDLSFKLNSLAWFMTPNGITELRKTKNLQTLQQRLDNPPPKPKILPMPDIKFGQDAKITNKPKSVMDFIGKNHD